MKKNKLCVLIIAILILASLSCVTQRHNQWNGSDNDKIGDLFCELNLDLFECFWEENSYLPDQKYNEIINVYSLIKQGIRKEIEKAQGQKTSPFWDDRTEMVKHFDSLIIQDIFKVHEFVYDKKCVLTDDEYNNFLEKNWNILHEFRSVIDSYKTIGVEK